MEILFCPFFGQKRLFHNMIFLLEFNERCLKRIARPVVYGGARPNFFWDVTNGVVIYFACFFENIL
ncbi:hypothetical protein B0A77_08900 [Flavobacterium branchiophilum]|uniref:Uncharacterized protein n=1 Tax=Flavobacterium branchiophilum TaxID=55197 RepID=A0A2H3KV30_9FLAO|nr:hypothetical protein B0A77_08900 [Flavobacterium branchiophilum]